MAQDSELNALGFASVARKNLVIAIMSVMLLAIAWQQRIIAAKDSVIDVKNDQIVRCKEEIAPTVERLMLRAEMNGQNQAQILANQARIEKKIDARNK